MKYDPNFIAEEKVSHESREQENQEYEKAAEELFDGQVFFVEKGDGHGDSGMCALPGCNKHKDNARDGNRYYSRRHFYLHRFRQGHGGDEWQKAAKCAVALLASEITAAEAKEEENDEGRPLTNTALVIFLFAVLGVFCSSWMLRDVMHLLIQRLKSFYFLFANEGILVNDNPRPVETSHGDLRPMDVVEERDDGLRLDHAVSDRWMSLYEEVRMEPGQAKWRWTNEVLWTPAVTAQMRGHILQHVLPAVRREEYLKLTLQVSCATTSDKEIRQWHRFLNSHFNFLMELHLDAREKEKVIRELREREGGNEHGDPHQAERLRFLEGQRCDRQQQTRSSHSHRTNEMVTTMHEGAWRFVSCYEDRL